MAKIMELSTVEERQAGEGLNSRHIHILHLRADKQKLGLWGMSLLHNRSFCKSLSHLEGRAGKCMLWFAPKDVGRLHFSTLGGLRPRAPGSNPSQALCTVRLELYVIAKHEMSPVIQLPFVDATGW